MIKIFICVDENNLLTLIMQNSELLFRCKNNSVIRACLCPARKSLLFANKVLFVARKFAWRCYTTDGGCNMRIKSSSRLNVH